MRSKTGITLATLAALAVLPLVVAPVSADFTIAGTVDDETLPAVAHNPSNGLFAAAYLRSGATGTYIEVQLHDADGNQSGTTKLPFGTGAVALSRPDIVFNPRLNEFLVGVVVAGSTDDDVLVRRLDGSGNVLSGPDFLFTGLSKRTFYPGQNVSSLRIAYGPVRQEYVVTVQLDTGPSTPQVAIWGQRFADDMTSFEAEVKLTPDLTDLWSHSIAATGWEIGEATYLLAYSQSNNGYSYLYLFDYDLTTLVANMPFDWGSPDWGCGYPDIAYGTIHKQPRFLVIWSDGNNHKPGTPSFPWTGIWGSFVDPTKTDYTPGVPENSPFPVSLIHSHMGTFQPYKPRVAYNSSAETFFIAWHEVPVNVPENDPVCTHIRATWVDYPAYDPLAHPYPNVVISDDTCNCLPQPSGPQFCDSEEDPRSPDISPFGTGGAVVVWHENWELDPTDQEVAADLFGFGPPPNDELSNAELVTGTDVTLECMVLGGTQDGGASCGSTIDEPDIWYEFTAPAHGNLHVSTCGTNDMFGPDTGMDTVLSIHEPNGDQLHPLACNDDSDVGQNPDACMDTDTDVMRDSYLNWALAAGQTVLIRLSRFTNTTGGHCMIHFNFIEGGGAGRIPDQDLWHGPPLMMELALNGQVNLYWAPSCVNSDIDYAVYEGELGNWTSHEPRLCSTNLVTEALIDPRPESAYYLVVPQNAAFEGSYGTNSYGDERPRGPGACADQVIAECMP